MQTRHLRPDDLRGRRWRGLVRESTAEQARKEATPERQRADLRRAAEELGMTPVEPLFYERVGSGEAEAVPELARALADGKAGQYDVLVVFHTSRFARNRAEAVGMKREFKRAGIVIYFASQRLISGAFTSALSEGISEVLDEHENEQRRLWIAGGLRERQRSGRWTGAIAFGYRKALVDFADGTRGWDGALEPDPDAAPLVRDIFARYLAGATARSIAFALNATGRRRPGGAVWASGTIQKLLTNPVYAGRLVRYRRPRSAYYYDRADAQDGFSDLGDHFPAIVEPGVCQAVAELMALRVRPAGARRFAYPLSGVLHCVSCGYPMGGGHNNRDTRYYRCRGRVEFGTCDAPFARADVMEERFAGWLGSYTLPADWRAEIARTRVQTIKSDERDRQRRLGERLERIRKLYAWGDMDEAEYRQESTTLRNEIGVMAMPSGSLEDVAEALERLGPAWESAPAALRAAFPRQILKAGEVSPDGHVEWVVKAELRPLLDLCVAGGSSLYSADPGYTVRYSA